MATPTETSTVETLTAEERAKRISELPDMAQAVLENVNKAIRAHNANVAIVKSASEKKKDEKELLIDIIEKNPHDDDRLKKLAADIEKKKQEIEALHMKGWEIAKQYLATENYTPEQVTAAHEATKLSSTEIRGAKEALVKLQPFLPGINLIELLDEMDSTRGVRLTTGENAGPGIRPTYKKIYIGHQDNKDERELIAKEVPTKNGPEMRSTTTMLAQELTKRIKGASVNSSEITTAFLASQKLQPNEFEKLTAGIEYKWTFSKDVFDSNGDKVGTKTFDLIFVK